jgi:CheY-like chemotaxis protein
VGLNTFEKVYSHSPHIPIIVLTGHDDDAFAIESVQKGAQDYLVKGQVTGGLLGRSIRYAIERKKLLTQLENSAKEINKLRGILPICANCKKIRDDKGYWTQVEVYISDHSETEFSHGLCPECAAKIYPDKSPSSTASTRKGRILVMDDEEIIRAVAGELLTELGHEAAFAQTGEAALDAYRAARDAGRPFDVVILDLTIRGGMGGMETLRKLVEIEPDVKAIVSSGYSDDLTMTNYREQGFKAFLRKPYDVEDLQKTLSSLLAET